MIRTYTCILNEHKFLRLIRYSFSPGKRKRIKKIPSTCKHSNPTSYSAPVACSISSPRKGPSCHQG